MTNAFRTSSSFASRRDFLGRAGGGLGALALASLLAEEGRSAPGLGLHRPRARSVIWCFLDGGPSHIDLFDPKPTLSKLGGQALPGSFKRPVTAMGRTAYTPLLASERSFARHGESGQWVSDWYPEIAKQVDRIAFVKGCQADGLNHVGSVCQMNTGSILAGRPSLGAWSVYGLGSENRDLPSFVVLLDNPDEPPGGPRNWGTGFVPANHQGTRLREGKTPILHLAPPEGPTRQRRKLDLIRELDRLHLETHPGGRASNEGELEARIESYELAWRLQSSAPEVVDLSGENEATRQLYGMDRKETAVTGRNCLLARRLVERGVRFVQLYFGSGSKWDAHSNLESNHSKHCAASDRPIAGLIEDLAQRGLLDETLVIWGGEFGRTPMSESGNGRDHNPFGFTMFFAGGGVKPGISFGRTDDLGLWAVEDAVHVHDLHATILWQLGIDHRELTFLHNGRNERATVDSGRVIDEILA